jgi:CPA1 family monovalent cation:H+ antiporter
MELLDIVAVLITLCALFSYLNLRYLRLPTTIGVMVISLSISLLLIALDSMGVGLTEEATQAIRGLHFDETLMRWMLGFLLFAGALHIDINELKEERFPVSILATIGVASCTALVGGVSYLLFHAVGLNIPLLYCLLFGALISPTDPIAVLGILRQVDAPRSLRVKMAGESLFNDGIGVVVFLVLLDITVGGHDPSVTSAVWLFIVEAIGGIVYGLAIGYLAYLMLKSVDNYQVEVLITLALVMGGYTLAQELHTSGLLAMVVAGLMIGNHGRALAMSETTREHLDTFWELLDEILNAVLFVLIGFELLILTLKAPYLIAGLLAVPAVLLSRFLSVGLPMSFSRVRRDTNSGPHVVKVLTWGGLRGGISVALALSLPAGAERDALVVVTYVVVAFSIIVQGLSFGPLLKRLYGPEA